MTTYAIYEFGTEKPIRKSNEVWDMYVNLPQSGNHKIVRFSPGEPLSVTIWCRSRGIVGDVTPRERDALMRILSYDNERDLENPEIPYEVAKALYKACDLVYGTDFRKVFAVQTPWVRNSGLLVCAEERNAPYMKILIEMGANVNDPKIMECLKARQGWDEPREYAQECMKVLRAAV